MAKELPYFKFEPSEWIMGNITLCSMEAQGLFINLCSYYWIKGGNICLTNAKQRFSKHDEQFEELLSKQVFDVNDKDEVFIKFLDEQFEKFADISVKRSKSGGLRHRTKANQMQSKSKANAHIGEETREDKIREDKSIEIRSTKFVSEVFTHEEYPKEMLQKFCNYWTEANKSKTKMRFELEKVFDIPRRLTTWSNNEKPNRQVNSVDPSIMAKYNNYGK